MQRTRIFTCYEIEQLRPCALFGKGKCPSCYAENLHKLRRATSRHVHKETPKHGLIRLGTYIEIQPPMWEAFKRGEGKWDCCGMIWKRHDFRTRFYFMISLRLKPSILLRKGSQRPPTSQLTGQRRHTHPKPNNPRHKPAFMVSQTAQSHFQIQNSRRRQPYSRDP